MTNEPSSLQRIADELAAQRDELATMAARMGLYLGWPSGRGDAGIYLQLPSGQVHYFVSSQRLLGGLPEFAGERLTLQPEQRRRHVERLPLLVDGHLRCGRCTGQTARDDDDLICIRCGERVGM